MTNRLNLTKQRAMNEALYISEYQSPIGLLLLAATDDNLVICAQKNVVLERKLIDKVLIQFNLTAEYQTNNHILEQASEWLDNYFSGIKNKNEPPLLYCGSPFQNKVWLKVSEIPYGATASYGEIAKATDNQKAIRAIANTIGANRLWIFIPCHRVIGANGKLTGYAGGLEAKKCLLDLEAKRLFGSK